MQSEVSWPLLIVSSLLWLLSLWLALFPHHVRRTWIRFVRIDAVALSPLVLRFVGTFSFILLSFVFWFNSRSHFGR
jgi:hypothetical protein